MNLDHLVLWAKDMYRIKDFYIRYFNATAGEKYHNPVKNFTSYFLTIPDGEVKLGIMNVPDIINGNGVDRSKEYCHMVISVGSRKTVDELTEKLRSDGISTIDNPRTTGDGYYKSVVSDPEGNLIEIHSFTEK